MSRICYRYSQINGGFSSQRASNAKAAVIPWQWEHQVYINGLPRHVYQLPLQYSLMEFKSSQFSNNFTECSSTVKADNNKKGSKGIGFPFVLFLKACVVASNSYFVYEYEYSQYIHIYTWAVYCLGACKISERL